MDGWWEFTQVPSSCCVGRLSLQLFGVYAAVSRFAFGLLFLCEPCAVQVLKVFQFYAGGWVLVHVAAGRHV